MEVPNERGVERVCNFQPISDDICHRISEQVQDLTKVIMTDKDDVCDFLVVRHSNLRHICCTISEILHGFVLMSPSSIHAILGNFSCYEIVDDVVNLSAYFKIFHRKWFSKYFNQCDLGTWTLQTDIRTTYYGITTLWIESPSKNEKYKKTSFHICSRVLCLLSLLS